VLLEEEVNPLISAVQDRDLKVNNHFFYENPRIFYMHLHGMGDPVDARGQVWFCNPSHQTSPF
jgi:Domain of Unknown Function (DUF1259)